ncbi:hypothetical protein [Tropicimonas aquimaris]|uniref:Uncharacterized protein n=1 Tax=Tropicimonas aquimaris TaxID=914152 RepID=A0ABW3IY73_9RHOB
MAKRNTSPSAAYPIEIMKLEDLSQAFEAFIKGDGLWLLLVLFVAGLVGFLRTRDQSRQVGFTGCSL